YYQMDQETAKLLNETKSKGHRVISVGTTSTRTLETIMQTNEAFKAQSGWTDIFIFPGYTFKAIDGLITNFHLPKSTLVMLVSAFSSRDYILNAYQQAVKSEYRFFSFGDAMLII
ncbi:MAG: S-adenosylmethionine:tRNA ribosyltransferase-isomerase, partial [Staphylococcus equorum]